MTKLHSLKVVKLLLGIFIFFLITYLFFDLVFGISNTLELHINSLPANLLTAFAIILLLMADILLPIPSTIVMVTSGILFGPFLGGVIALVGAVAGSIMNFLISRKLGQARVKKWLGDKEYQRLSVIMQKYGAYIVILTRMVPLFMESVGSISGVSNMKLKNFILLNIIGFAPIVFFLTYAGSVYKEEPNNIFIAVAVGFFAPLILWYVFLKAMRIRY